MSNPPVTHKNTHLATFRSPICLYRLTGLELFWICQPMNYNFSIDLAVNYFFGAMSTIKCHLEPLCWTKSRNVQLLAFIFLDGLFKRCLLTFIKKKKGILISIFISSDLSPGSYGETLEWNQIQGCLQM